MKTLFSWLIILLGCSTGLWAQYQAVLSGDSIQYVLSGEIQDGTVFYTLDILGDTSIAAFTYRPLLLKLADGQPWNVYPGGLIREDTLAGQLWWRDPDAEEELLVQDMNWAIGDTIPITAEFLSCSTAGFTTVQSVDWDSVGRKIISTDCMYGVGFIWDTLRFIEGVGPNASLLWSCIAQRANNLTCEGFAYSVCEQYRDGVLSYQADLCPMGGVSTAERKLPSVQVFPNPATHLLRLQIEEPLVSTVLYDWRGRVVRSFSTSEQELSLIGLPAGIYLLRLHFSDNRTSVHQVVKLDGR